MDDRSRSSLGRVKMEQQRQSKSMTMGCNSFLRCFVPRPSRFTASASIGHISSLVLASKASDRPPLLEVCRPSPKRALRAVVRQGSSLLLLLLLAAAPVHADLIDRVVASVDHSVITLSELNQAVAFNKALGSPGGDRIAQETLEGLINRRLLVEEARRLRFVEVTDQDVKAEIAKLRQRLGSDKAFESFLSGVGVTQEQLSRMLGERLLVERFVEKKIGLFIRVTRDEAQEYFNAHPGRFAGKRFSEVQKAITAGLQGQKLDAQTAKYLSELRSKADIRVQL